MLNSYRLAPSYTLTSS